MQLKISDIEYKGHYFEEVTVDIPKITAVEDNTRLIRYFIFKELDRILRG